MLEGQPVPPLTRPPDFDRFWSATRAELAGVAARPKLERVDAKRGLVLERLTFGSLGGARVHGYVLRATDGAARPLVVHGHGYGSEVTPMWQWARAGVDVVGVDVRGYGESERAAPDTAPSGYILTGSEAPETHILRGAVCDYMRAVEVARDLLGAQAPRTVLHGFSFAGGLAVMAEAQLQVADLLVLGVPSLGWAEGRRLFATGGSGNEINRYLDSGFEAHDEEDLMVVFRYFDSMNFADRVRCPTLVGVGEVDLVVPQPTVLAIASRLAGRTEVMTFPVSHSESPEERRWDEFEARWLRLAVKGVPERFGAYSTPSA